MRPVDINVDGRTEIVVAKTLDIATAEAQRRGSRWAMQISLLDLQRGHPFPGVRVILVMQDPSDQALANAILANWKCQVAFERLDIRPPAHA